MSIPIETYLPTPLLYTYTCMYMYPMCTYTSPNVYRIFYYIGDGFVVYNNYTECVLNHIFFFPADHLFYNYIHDSTSVFSFSIVFNFCLMINGLFSGLISFFYHTCMSEGSDVLDILF